MENRFPAERESEPVDYTQMRDHIAGFSGAIAASLAKRLASQGYTAAEILKTQENLTERTTLLRNGLKPDMDYSFLRPQIGQWLDMALTVVQTANSLDTSANVIKKALDAVQGVLIVNGALTDETRAQLTNVVNTQEQSP